jgi:hypothetical protein
MVKSLGLTLVVLTGWVVIHASAREVTDLAVPDRANAYASIATSGRLAVIAWGAATTDGATDVYAAVSQDGGRTFGGPSRVNGGTDLANLSGEQPPRIALVRRAGTVPTIIVVWTAKTPTGTRLLTARSDDGGKSFKAAAPVPGADAPGNRGWESVVAGRDGSILAMWLDHRDTAPKTGASSMDHSQHQHVTSGENKPDGVARAQLSQLFFANLAHADSAHSVARGVCYCCKTALTSDTSGRVYTAWRHVYDGNVRDIAFSQSADGGRTFTTPVRISHDNWQLDGCPENGPAIAVDSSQRIHVVWPTLVPGATSASPPSLGLFYASSTDGVRFTDRQQIPTRGVPRHAQIALGSRDRITIAWDEQSGGKRNIAIARATADPSGTPTFSRQSIVDDAPGAYPFVATVDTATIVGWTSGVSGQTVIRVTEVK